MSSGTPQQISRVIRNCTNNTNIDTIQCEAYAPKLRQRPPVTGIMGPQPKSVYNKPNRERSASRSRCGQSTLLSNIPMGRCSNNVSVLNNRVRRENSVNSVVRKEVYTSADNPALVEVTVKTHGQQNVPQHRKQSVKSINMGNRGEPWNKILQQNNLLSGIVSEGNNFRNFDPLRTVHFLAQELHSKIQNSLSDDDHSIRQIISDMQQALHRVPPEVASTLGLSISPQYGLQHKPPATPIINGSFNYDYPTKDDLRQERLLGIVKGDTISNTVERGCQTAKCRNMVLEPEKFQQHLEFSTAKIESACRQMEVVCSKLKTDKEELERELLSEQEIVLKLRTQLEQTSCQQDATKLNVEHLQTERNSLQQELQQLKLQLIGTTSQSPLMQQLQTQKTAVEEQLANYKQQLTIAKMETGKYVAILAARDKQVMEIRSEMNQLQEVVMDQLREIQTGPFSSSVTSCTTNTTSKQSFTWPPTQKSNSNNFNTQQRYKLDGDIHKEIVGAMEATTDMIINNGAGSTTRNGGETTATNSGVSSTTTISNVNMGSSTKDVLTSKMVQIDFTVDRDRQQNGNSKSNVDMSNIRMAANLMLDTCGEINSDNEIVNNHQQQQTNVSGPLHSVSIREMFAEIKKQALLINTIPQKST